jgi:hypothetical protein
MMKFGTPYHLEAFYDCQIELSEFFTPEFYQFEERKLYYLATKHIPHCQSLNDAFFK